MTQMDDRLQNLWNQYRQACPAPESSAEFMPELWRRIDSRRQLATAWFRRWAEICVVTTIAAAVLLTTVVIPSYLREPVYQASYVDVLNAAAASSDAAIATIGEFE